MSGAATSSTTTLAAPQGRSQLLYWLNGLCNSDYPAIESLRDGAAYCTILEAAINRIAENCRAVGTKDAENAAQRSQRASAVLARLDWSATSHVCNDVDPTLDSILVSASCRKNMEVLLEMTAHCIPPDHVRRIDVERMARGRFQDHVQFLQWLYQFMSKVLLTYSKSALQEAMSTPSGVEGVKLNRTMRMRQQTASTRSSSARVRESRRTTTSLHTPRAFSAHTAPRTGHAGESDDTVVVEHAEPDHTPSAEGDVRHGAERAALPAPRTTHTTSLSPSSTPSAAPPAAPVYWDRGAVTVPAPEKENLLELRRDVEQVEALVLYACDVYQRNLTRSSSQDNDVGVQESNDVVRACFAKEPALTPPPTPTVPLSELGRLLDERDEMTQRYERIRLLLLQYERLHKTSPLIRDVKAVLQSGASSLSPDHEP